MTTGATPAASGSAPVDLRERVDQDRGTLKKLELLIPGYHGYRQGEDIRAADSLLRRQVADRLRNARFTAENARAALTQAGQFAPLNDLAPLIADLMRIEPKVRSAEQGYSGIAAAIKVGPQQLDKLYEYDYGFVMAVDQFSQTMGSIPGSVASASWPLLAQSITSARAQLTQLDQAFGARTRVVEGVEV
ncbi:MAG: hypothetical protein ACREBZ_07410 [Thermoplasmata archaeon]